MPDRIRFRFDSLFYTMVSEVVEGALNACRVAYKLIDMTKQHGEHPRMGACDVCPFVPIRVGVGAGRET